MKWFNDLLFGHSVAHTIFILSIVIFSGILLGKIKIKGISLSIGGVMFAGIIFGHSGMGFNAEVLDFVRDFGLVLFVYTIGAQAGPVFFASFRKEGIALNLLVTGNIAMNLLTASLIVLLAGLPAAVVVGILSGAITNTPGLGAAQEALRGISGGNSEIQQYPGLGYAIAYPFGIIGIIGSIILSSKLFRINLEKESAAFAEEKSKTDGAPVEHSMVVMNQGIDGKSIGKLKSIIDGEFMITGICREGEFVTPTDASILAKGDILRVLCRSEQIKDIALMVGDITELDFTVPTRSLSRDFNVTNKETQKKPLGKLDFAERLGVNIVKVERAGFEMFPSAGLKLCFGDTVTATGPESALAELEKELGNSEKDLEHPNLVPIFIGIAAGIIIGMVPFYIPGLAAPVKLGIAGGPLLVALVLSRIRKIGPLNWHLSTSANLILREMGITLFLACVGIKCGERFFSTLFSQQGVLWIVSALAITMIPLMLTALAGRYLMKMNFLTLSGLMAGGCTDPPALSYACQISKNDAPLYSYAAVYSYVMFMRIITAQLFILIFCK
ncbi:MAG: hypothetical protein A2020_13575 [Lentisphaerae bacterium GWF2_45_14]|nr:MAG: hypothetical protein A2020_13575 [Lentisphaerae bacterium GWF2_45_14]